MSFAHSSNRTTNSTRSSIVTHPSLHIRDAHDAHIVLEAVRQNILPLIRRRLLSSEREDLASGHVYVWEEAQDEGGLLRWTDGRRWSQSRMRGDYLFYEEKVETTQEERDAKAARRARRASDSTAVIPPPTRRKDRPSKPNGLTKQTYSVAVNLPGSNESRKWHVVAYFSGNDYTRLPVVENYDYLRNILVPHGVFMSSKIMSARLDRFSYYSDESEMYDDGASTVTATPYNGSTSPSPPMSSMCSSPYMVRSPVRHPLALHSPPPGEGHHRISLPPITTLGHAVRRPSHPRPHMGSSSSGGHFSGNYTPLSPEDRRVLDSFRVIL